VSYCRFSSDDFRSDVYVYDSVLGGWQVHVASRRHANAAPRPEYPDGWHRAGETGIELFMAHTKAMNAWLEAAEMVPIGLPRDGESQLLGSPGEAADMLQELKDMGYIVPDGVIDTLREEQKDLD
jgi:hypothetical protein